MRSINTTKTIIAISMVAAALSGCAPIPKNPTVSLESVKVNVNAEPEEMYAAMTQCVLDNVNPAASGQLFTYQSEKNSQFAFVYGFGTPWTIMGMPYLYDSRATVRFNGKTGKLRSQGIKLYFEPTQFTVGRWGTPTNGELIDSSRREVNAMLHSLADCVPTYL